MAYIIKNSITEFHQKLNLDAIFSQFDWSKNLYSKYVVNSNPYFIKIEIIRDQQELVDDYLLKKVCQIEHRLVLKYYDILIIDQTITGKKALVSICDYIYNLNFLEYVTHLHGNKTALTCFIDEIINIFDYLHDRSILHQDINLDNFGIVPTENGFSPILLDFNFYKSNVEHLVATPEFLDPTYDYLTPYTIHNEKRGLAVLIYFLLTFDLPFFNRLTQKDQRGSHFRNDLLKTNLLNDNELELIMKLVNNEQLQN